MRLTPLWRWAIGWSLVVLVFSCIPYLVAIFMAPEGWQFAGILVNPYDNHSYLAKMQQGFEGSWLLHLTYTPEPHEGVYIYLFYLFLGHMARLTHLPLIIVFHLVRLVAGFTLLMVVFSFIQRITSQANEQRLAFVLLLTAAGLGWLGVIVHTFPIDLWVPEAFVPYSIYTNPHFPLGLALMVITLQAVVWPKENLIFYTIFSGLAALTLALVLPFALLTIWAVLAVYLGWLTWRNHRLPWLQLWLVLVTFLFAAPIIFYYYWVSRTNPIIAGWSAQNITPAPTIIDLGLGLGAVGILAVVGGCFIIRNKQYLPGEWLVLLWAVTTLALVYLPIFDLQRRLINGLHIPLCILAAVGLARWLNQLSLSARRRQQIINAAVILGLLGTMFVWAIPLLGLYQSPSESETSALFYLRQQEIDVFKWLRKNTVSDDVILTSTRLGMFVPEQTGARAFYGHPFETINADHKKALTEAFFRGEIDTVSPLPDYIIYGHAEQAIGEPANLKKYSIVYATRDIVVYRVQ
jgi:hypothetical protein